MEKCGCVKVIDGEEVRGDDPVEYFFPAGVRSTSRVPEGVMAIEVPQISGGGKNGGRKGDVDRFVKRDVDPYIIRVEIKQRK